MHITQTHLFKFWQRWEHHLSLGALVVGFCVDLVLAKRPDSVVDNLLLFSYLLVAGLTIIALNIRARRTRETEPILFLLMLQFCFGGLASNLLILYGKSGTLTVDAIFVGLLVCLVLGNEYLRNRYTLLRLNIGLYYFLLLTYATIAVPVFVTHAIGGWVFLLSGALSLVWMGVFFTLLRTVALRGRDLREMRSTYLVVASIYLAFNLCYFLNVIPPVPLSLKGIGIYHSILPQSDGSYVALYEPAPWWEFWRDTSATYTLSAGDSAFCFSSVFAPADLTAPIEHRWEELDPATGRWETQSLVSFPISGGRAQGYRGWSVKSGLTPGEWRCDVETQSGALIGRVEFTAVAASASPALSQTTL